MGRAVLLRLGCTIQDPSPMSRRMGLFIRKGLMDTAVLLLQGELTQRPFSIVQEDGVGWDSHTHRSLPEKDGRLMGPAGLLLQGHQFQAPSHPRQRNGTPQTITPH